MVENSELVLIEKCRSGDSLSFGRLMQSYRQQLFSYLFRLCGAKEEAKDIMQETLIKIWEGFGRYDERQKFSSWVFTIAHNSAMDVLRKRKNEIAVSETLPDELQHSTDIHAELVNAEMKKRIIKAVDSLPVKQKEVFLLRLNSRMSFKEISELTKEPLNTVLSHMHYSVKKIKRIIENENE